MNRFLCGGYCFHVLNRGNGRATVFHDADDYDTMIVLLDRACERLPMRVLAYCLMSNHFHLVLQPFDDTDLSRWMHWLLTSHVRGYHRRYQTSGHVWQGRFKAFAVHNDRHLYAVLRYVERNPVRAGLVEQAQHLLWASLRGRRRKNRPRFLTDSPMAIPRTGHVRSIDLRRSTSWRRFDRQSLAGRHSAISDGINRPPNGWALRPRSSLTAVLTRLVGGAS